MWANYPPSNHTRNDKIQPKHDIGSKSSSSDNKLVAFIESNLPFLFTGPPQKKGDKPSASKKSKNKSKLNQQPWQRHRLYISKPYA